MKHNTIIHIIKKLLSYITKRKEININLNIQIINIIFSFHK